MQNGRSVFYKLFDSINVKIIALIVLFILPLNIGLILTNLRTIEAVRGQAQLALENVGGLYLQRLEGRMTSTDYYFYDLNERDSYFIRLQDQDKDDAYFLAKTNVASEFNRSIQTSNNADAYFYANMVQDDFLLTLPGEAFNLNSPLLRNLRVRVGDLLLEQLSQRSKQWQIVSTSDSDWLLRIYGDDAFLYGGLISLNHFVKQVQAAVEYQTLAVKLGTGLENTVDKDTLSVLVESDRHPIQMLLRVSMEEIDRGLPQVRRFSLILAVLSLLIIPFIILILNKILLKPLNKIRSALSRLKSGDQSYRIGPHQQYSEEFRTINQSFNAMADSISSLKIENYEKEIENKNLALRSLQLHIRPHFLLNTFNLVYSLAQVKEYKSIQTLALYLSDYFRYIFRSGKELEPFLLEFQMIQKYLDVSLIRYPKSFQVTYDVEEDAFEVLVPPLMIHTLVENVIMHALDRERQIQIIISAHVIGPLAVFAVSDTGKGIPSDILERLNHSDASVQEAGESQMGIRNASQRIKHLFGDEGVLQVSSEAGKGTTVKVSFPYIKAMTGGDNVETVDRQ